MIMNNEEMTYPVSDSGNSATADPKLTPASF